VTTSVADSVNTAVPAKPPYRHGASDPPAALAHLRDERVWCVWDYQWKEAIRKWDKPPISRCGRGYRVSVTDPRNWCTWDEALAAVAKYGRAGIGLVLEAAKLSGADFDHCITDSGSYLPAVAEAISFGETYGEVSPSGSGVHMLIEGASGITIKRDDIGIELYERGRYFTVTGEHISDLPAKIGPAPRLIEHLKRLDAETPKPGKEKNSAKATRLNGHANVHANGYGQQGGDDFFSNVKAAALDNLDAWVPSLHPSARKQATGALRVKSMNMGRDQRGGPQLPPRRHPGLRRRVQPHAG
jgi:hypothetical protein